MEILLSSVKFEAQGILSEVFDFCV